MANLWLFCRNPVCPDPIWKPVKTALHSAKGGAVETGCSDLYAVVY